MSFSSNVDIYGFMGKKRFFKTDLNNGKKQIFILNCSQKSGLHRNVDIFGYKWLFKSDLKQNSFSRNVNIYGLMDKKRFLKSDLKITSFSSKYLYIRINIFF